MQRIALAMACMLVSAGHAHSAECIKTIGVEADVPPAVSSALSSAGLGELKLVDRMACPNRIMWLAIPPEWVGRPLPPDLAKGGVYEIETAAVHILSH